jgi:hypothetical protein
MWRIVLIGFVLVMMGAVAMGQNGGRELRADHARVLDLSQAAEARFEAIESAGMAAQLKLDGGTAKSDLTAEELKALKQWEKQLYYKDSGYWDILGGGCSWYCGGGADTIIASSTLKPQGNISYDARHAEDLSYKTVWVEGVPGYGIGEYLLYKFRPATPSITEIIVVNGYVKNEKAYRENSRVKKLKVYLNDQPYAVLNLDDKRSSQHFKIPTPLGRERNDKSPLALPWSLKFQIAEVYKGTKYDDTVITEIYFDGTDVH